MDRELLLQGMDTKRRLFGTFFAFNNQLQTAGDAFYDEITCKQFFLIICLSVFKEEPPTINDLSEVMGSTHQNVKQILNKLEESGYIRTYQDEKDKRKCRIMMTEKIILLEQKYKVREMEFMELFYKGITEEEVNVTLQTLLKLEKNLSSIREEMK